MFKFIDNISVKKLKEKRLMPNENMSTERE